MNAEQIAKLKEVALKAPKNPGEWPFYLRSFQAAASPDVILELIALAERAIVAESRVAEIQRGVEGLLQYIADHDWGGIPEPVTRIDELRALLQPQGQASDTSGLPDDQIIKRAGEIFGFKPHKQTEEYKQRLIDFARWCADPK